MKTLENRRGPKVGMNKRRSIAPLKKVHIGRLMESYCFVNKISPDKAAELMGMTRQNVYKVWNSHSLKTDLVDKISKAFGFNFFTYYTSNPSEQLDLSAIRKEIEEKVRAELMLELKKKILKKNGVVQLSIPISHESQMQIIKAVLGDEYVLSSNGSHK